MKSMSVAAAVLLASAMAAPGAFAQGAGGNGGNSGGSPAAQANGGVNALPSQRIIQNQANGTGALIAIAPSGVREVQQRLNQLGYFAGPVNGVWDRATADAMVHFQQAHGLEPTGNLNFSSIAGLGLYERLISNPLGNNNEAFAANATGAPPPRGTEGGSGGGQSGQSGANH